MAQGCRPIHVSLRIALAVVVLAIGSLASRAEAAGDAGEFLVSFGRHAAQELRDQSLSQDEREGRFRELFSQAVDVPAIGRFILGAHWPGATARERADFLAVFEEVALQRVLPMFSGQPHDYAGKSFDVVAQRRAANNRNHIFVYALVTREKGPPVHLTWRVHETGGQFKILDISAEGISMALTLRQEYNSVIRRSGGVAGLVDLMRRKLRAGAFAPRASSGVK
jgi:phospholipid transport system substrate-binding protein